MSCRPRRKLPPPLGEMPHTVALREDLTSFRRNLWEYTGSLCRVFAMFRAIVVQEQDAIEPLKEAINRRRAELEEKAKEFRELQKDMDDLAAEIRTLEGAVRAIAASSGTEVWLEPEPPPAPPESIADCLYAEWQPGTKVSIVKAIDMVLCRAREPLHWTAIWDEVQKLGEFKMLETAPNQETMRTTLYASRRQMRWEQVGAGRGAKWRKGSIFANLRTAANTPKLGGGGAS